MREVEGILTELLIEMRMYRTNPQGNPGEVLFDTSTRASVPTNLPVVGGQSMEPTS